MRKTEFPYQSLGVVKKRKEYFMEENITIEELFENIQEAYDRACDGCEETECFSLDRCLKPDICGEEYCEHIARKHFYSNWKNEQFVRSFLKRLLGLPNLELDGIDKKELGPEVIGYACELFGPGPLRAFDILMSSLYLSGIEKMIDDMLDEMYAHLVITDYEEKKENGALETRPIEELFKELDL